jgi:hypothetical protein
MSVVIVERASDGEKTQSSFLLLASVLAIERKEGEEGKEGSVDEPRK